MTPNIIVGFCHSSNWWQKILKPGFGHVYVIIKDKSCGKWVCFDPKPTQMGFKILNEKGINANRKHFSKHVWISVKKDATKGAQFLTGNCVTRVKYIMGIKARHVWTPWQLYKYLKRNFKCQEIQA